MKHALKVLLTPDGKGRDEKEKSISFILERGLVLALFIFYIGYLTGRFL